MAQELVALDLPGGLRFVEALQRTWDRGDAVLPIDQRLPHQAKRNLVEAMGAHRIVVPDQPGPVASGTDPWPTEPGDALVVATSGTTGQPKGVVLTHDAVAASATMTSGALRIDPQRHRWLACLPLAHIGGLSVVTRALHTGTPFEVHDGFDAAAVQEAAASGVTHVSLVVAALGRVQPDAFDCILLGGSAIPTQRPANTVATYGMTETGSGIVYEGWPLEGVRLDVRDGEILVQSPTLLRCYRDGTVPYDSNGWYPTGDAGALSADGKLSVQGRIGDVIVTGAEKVWPTAVEKAIGALNWVQVVAVVGLDDPKWGQAVTAAVVVKPNHHAPSLPELRDQLADQLPRYALPQRLHVLDALPQTAIGKVQRETLVSQLAGLD